MQNHASDRQLNIVDYWRIVLRFKWMIGGLIMTAAFSTGILCTYFLPKLYETKATLLPAVEDPTSGGMSFGGGQREGRGGGGQMIMKALGYGTGGPDLLDTLNVILRSHMMAEAVVRDLNLLSYYGAKSVRAATSVLLDEVKVKTTEWKSLEVTVLSREPQMAADIANSYVSNLDRLNRELNLTVSRRFRMFVEARLAEKADKLAKEENALKVFQNENRIRVNSGGGGNRKQSDLGIADELYARIVALEVNLASLREYALPSHPMINQLQAQIHELRNQLDRLELEKVRGTARQKRTRVRLSEKLYPSFEEQTSLELDVLRLQRRVKIEELVHGMLVGMLESAKLAEAREMPTIQVMDRALPPSYHSKPATPFNMLVAGALSLVLGIFLAVFLNYLERLRAEEKALLQTTDGLAELGVGDPNGDRDNPEVQPVSPREAERLHS